MKTATISVLRVEPELRNAAEEILRPGDTLSAFVEDSLRCNQQEFFARGRASLSAALEIGEYVTAKKVLSKLSAKLEKARSKNSTKSSYRIRFTLETEDDLIRILDFYWNIL